MLMLYVNVFVIFLSLLSCDFVCMVDELCKVIVCGVDWLYLDVMDGYFVLNLMFGVFVFMLLCLYVLDVYFDVYLMVMNLLDYIEFMVKVKMNMFMFYVEACDGDVGVERACEEVWKVGMEVGIVIKLGMVVDVVYLSVEKGLCDMVFVMIVELGFGG